jgi:murein DD-endopeptidase MepM/ murein hydrolase activator NlpD
LKKRKKILSILLVFLIIGLIIPQNLLMPVKGATKSDYNSESFWYYPWGKSGTHKGVDIFAKEGTEINSSTKGIVIRTGENKMGGKFIMILGPKWRVHYYAHLKEVKTSTLSFVNKKSIIGLVGTSGNAKGKSPHLHYSIITMVPYLWRIDFDKQGWKKMFYLNPISYL